MNPHFLFFEDPDDEGCSWQAMYRLMGCKPNYEEGSAGDVQ